LSERSEVSPQADEARSEFTTRNDNEPVYACPVPGAKRNGAGLISLYRRSSFASLAPAPLDSGVCTEKKK